MPPSRRQTQLRVAADLPAYEPPILPLHKDGFQVLNSIQSSSSSVEKYLTAALQLLTTAASDLGERTSKDHKDSPAKAERQKVLDALELAARDTVDTGAKLQDSKELICNITATETARIQQVEQSHRRRAAERRQAGAESGDEDEESENQANYEVVPVEQGLWSRYKNGFESKREQYEARPDVQKYADVAEYKDFRRTLWDAQNPDAPVPPERTWFADADAADDSDDDIRIAQEVQSYNCPLTMLPFKNPMKSMVCNHVFETAAIAEMIQKNRQRRVDCPVPGCSKKLTINSLQSAPDILLKMQRQEKRMARMRARQEDEDDEEEEEKEVARPQRVAQVKREKGGKIPRNSRSRRKPRVVAIEDEGEGVDEDGDVEMSQ